MEPIVPGQNLGLFKVQANLGKFVINNRILDKGAFRKKSPFFCLKEETPFAYFALNCQKTISAYEISQFRDC
ncbi:hypothetical protein CQA01_44890 [Cyclobacterium qasimii]|uniref:Uncharacterized protein n=1 Tax=Cyclobacterium qasimii TaxID=1350429 RepID=A0A512CID6_9BACT|nr:hypothetical protein CQA01_44890 [Cyclobacterium qasimii]